MFSNRFMYCMKLAIRTREKATASSRTTGSRVQNVQGRRLLHSMTTVILSSTFILLGVVVTKLDVIFLAMLLSTGPAASAASASFVAGAPFVSQDAEALLDLFAGVLVLHNHPRRVVVVVASGTLAIVAVGPPQKATPG